MPAALPDLNLQDFFQDILANQMPSRDFAHLVHALWRAREFVQHLSPEALATIQAEAIARQSAVGLHGRADQPLSLNLPVAGSNLTYHAQRQSGIPFTAAARVTIDYSVAGTERSGIEAHYHPVSTALLCLQGRSRYYLYLGNDYPQDDLPLRDQMIEIDLVPGTVVFFPRGTFHTCSPETATVLLNCTTHTSQPAPRSIADLAVPELIQKVVTPDPLTAPYVQLPLASFVQAALDCMRASPVIVTNPYFAAVPRKPNGEAFHPEDFRAQMQSWDDFCRILHDQQQAAR